MNKLLLLLLLLLLLFCCNYGNNEFIAILFVLTLHLKLGFWQLVIICWWLKPDTKAGIIHMVIHDDDIRLAVLVTLLPGVYSLVSSWFSPKPAIKIAPEQNCLMYCTTLVCKSVSLSILNMWLLGLSNSLYCPYFLMDGDACGKTQSRNILAAGNFEPETSS